MFERDSAVKWIVGGFVLFIIVVAFGLFQDFMHPPVKVQLGGQFLDARVADTVSERNKGLSGSKSLSEKAAMLFIFDTTDKWGIWMKDMNYSIDVIWLDENKKVVDIAQQVSPDTYPNNFRPKTAAKYVLEVQAGFAERYQVGIGTMATFHGL